MRRLRSILAFALVYLALTANLEALNILVGLLVGTAVSFLLPASQTKLQPHHWPQIFWASLRYIVMVAWDLIVSGLQVARIVLSPKMPIQPGIIAIPSQTDSDLATALSAHAITLTPGEFVVEIDEDGVMYTHVLDIEKSAANAQDAQTQRTNLLEKIVP